MRRCPNDAADLTKLHGAARQGDEEPLRNLIAAGCDLDATLGGGMTAAGNAAFFGNANCLALLIQAGCDLTSENHQKKTAADLAQVNGHMECVTMIRAEIERRKLAALLGFDLAGGSAPPRI